MAGSRLTTLLLALAGFAPAACAAADGPWYLSSRPETPSSHSVHLGALPARFALSPQAAWVGWNFDGGYQITGRLLISASYFSVRAAPSRMQLACERTFACRDFSKIGPASRSVSGFSASLSQSIAPALSVYGSLGLMRMDWRFPALHELPSQSHSETHLFSDVGLRYRFYHGPSVEIGTEQLQVDMSVTRINFTWEP